MQIRRMVYSDIKQIATLVNTVGGLDVELLEEQYKEIFKNKNKTCIVAEHSDSIRGVAVYEASTNQEVEYNFNVCDPLFGTPRRVVLVSHLFVDATCNDNKIASSLLNEVELFSKKERVIQIFYFAPVISSAIFCLNREVLEDCGYNRGDSRLNLWYNTNMNNLSQVGSGNSGIIFYKDLFEIRRVTEDMIDSIEEIYEQAFGASTNKERGKRSIRELSKNEDYYMLAVVDIKRDKPIAFVQGIVNQFFTDYKVSSLTVWGLCVSGGYKHKGIGSYLLKYLESKSRQNSNCQSVWLFSDRSTPLCEDFYKKCGYSNSYNGMQKDF